MTVTVWNKWWQSQLWRIFYATVCHGKLQKSLGRFFPCKNVSLFKDPSLMEAREDNLASFIVIYWWFPILSPKCSYLSTVSFWKIPSWTLRCSLVLTSYNNISEIFSWQEWTDDNLRWNESEYGDIKDLRIPPAYIWAPDILMYNR